MENDSLNKNAAARHTRLIYIVLAIFLGALGIHNFYAGRNKQGLIQLLITVLSFGMLGIISWVWAIFDIITVTTDGAGNTPSNSRLHALCSRSVPPVSGGIFFASAFWCAVKHFSHCKCVCVSEPDANCGLAWIGILQKGKKTGAYTGLECPGRGENRTAPFYGLCALQRFPRRPSCETAPCAI